MSTRHEQEIKTSRDRVALGMCYACGDRPPWSPEALRCGPCVNIGELWRPRQPVAAHIAKAAFDCQEELLEAHKDGGHAIDYVNGCQSCRIEQGVEPAPCRKPFS